MFVGAASGQTCASTGVEAGFVVRSQDIKTPPRDLLLRVRERGP